MYRHTLFHCTSLYCTSQMCLSQIEGKTLHQQKHYNSLSCGGLQLNLQYVQGLPVPLAREVSLIPKHHKGELFGVWKVILQQELCLPRSQNLEGGSHCDIKDQQSEPQYSTMSRHQNHCVPAMSQSRTHEVERPAYTPGLQSIPMEEGKTDPDVQVPPSHAGSPGPSRGVLVPGTPPPPNSALGRESWGQLFNRPCSEHLISQTLTEPRRPGELRALKAERPPDGPLLPAHLLPGLWSCIT